MLVATQSTLPTTKRIFSANEGAVSTYRSAKLKETWLVSMAMKLKVNYQNQTKIYEAS